MIEAEERELSVRVSAGRGGARPALLRRAVAASCSNADLPIDRIDDAIVILETLLAGAALARAEQVDLVLTARPGSLALLLGPLARGEVAHLLEDAARPTAGPVIARMATSASAVQGGSHLLVVVQARP